MQYASTLDNLNLQAIIAPLIDMEFNRCKSPIKYYEACALGIPLFSTKCLPYLNVVPNEQMYENADDLHKKLTKLKFSSAGYYRSLIEQQYKWLSTPKNEGDFKLKNLWMEDNIDIWINLGKIRQKTFTINMSHFANQYKAKHEKVIYNDQNGVTITK
jgi:hypothetical protein